MKKGKNTYPKFSFFDGPITNPLPRSLVTIVDVYRGISAGYYMDLIKKLRSATNQDKRKQIKQGLDYVTFAGSFAKREKSGLVKPSGYCCIDLDHLAPGNLEKIKKILLQDPMFETQLLFTSPSGEGLKWIIEVDLISYPDYELNFRGLVGYLKHNYPEFFNVETNYIDETGKDISRACFMSWDPSAFINPKYLNNEN
ncbi:MAG: virulence protein E [Mariniphaga sp.]|nr:virulence protein E [Mariniphaga sp.]